MARLHFRRRALSAKATQRGIIAEIMRRCRILLVRTDGSGRVLSQRRGRKAKPVNGDNHPVAGNAQQACERDRQARRRPN